MTLVGDLSLPALLTSKFNNHSLGLMMLFSSCGFADGYWLPFDEAKEMALKLGMTLR